MRSGGRGEYAVEPRRYVQVIFVPTGAFHLAFDRFKKTKQAPVEGGSSTTGEVGSRNPGKARQFFEHAKTVQETGNYAYAMTLWLQGLRQDLSDMDGLERLVQSALLFAEGQRKPAPTKEQTKQFSGRNPVDRYLLALLNWAVKPVEVGAGLKAMEAAVKAQANEPAYWIGEKVLRVASGDPRSKKDTFVQLMKLFQKCGGGDKAVLAGEQAIARDRTDHALDTEVRNLSAQTTLTRGGFEQTGQTGGFRANVRDTGVQRELEEEDRIVKTEEVQERSIQRALDDYANRPTDNAAIQKAAKVLRDRGKPEDLKQAYQILMKGYETNQNYRFRSMAGDIKLMVERRKLLQIRREIASKPDDASLKEKLAAAERKALEREVEEFLERVANMPTDLKLRFELAQRCMKVENYEAAIDNFQAAVDSPQYAQRSRRGLAEAFGALGWNEEAESTYRQAIEGHESENDDSATDLRYGLLTVLEAKARDSGDVDAAEEAFKLASGIAIKKIGYKDIRERRNAIQELVKELKAAAT